MKSLKILFFLIFNISVSCTAFGYNKLLIAGDSWAAFLCGYGSFNQVWTRYRFLQAQTDEHCWRTTKMGIRAEQWLNSKQDHYTLKRIQEDQEIQVVFLSLGGNDLMNELNKDMTLQEQEALFIRIRSTISNIISKYKSIRPRLRVIVSGYDYPRFVKNHNISAYRKAYEEMGEPTAEELNRSLIHFSQTMAEIGNQKDIAYIHHLGLMHYYQGNTEEGLLPGVTLHPDQISSPTSPITYGGLETLKSCFYSMMRFGTAFIDAFHLSPVGYYRLAEHTHRTYLRKWL